jgi:hypothetical protein
MHRKSRHLQLPFEHMVTEPTDKWHLPKVGPGNFSAGGFFPVLWVIACAVLSFTPPDLSSAPRTEFSPDHDAKAQTFFLLSFAENILSNFKLVPTTTPEPASYPTANNSSNSGKCAAHTAGVLPPSPSSSHMANSGVPRLRTPY